VRGDRRRLAWVVIAGLGPAVAYLVQPLAQSGAGLHWLLGGALIAGIGALGPIMLSVGSGQPHTTPPSHPPVRVKALAVRSPTRPGPPPAAAGNRQLVWIRPEIREFALPGVFSAVAWLLCWIPMFFWVRWWWVLIAIVVAFIGSVAVMMFLVDFDAEGDGGDLAFSCAVVLGAYLGVTAPAAMDFGPHWRVDHPGALYWAAGTLCGNILLIVMGWRAIVLSEQREEIFARELDQRRWAPFPPEVYFPPNDPHLSIYSALAARLTEIPAVRLFLFPCQQFCLAIASGSRVALVKVSSWSPGTYTNRPGSVEILRDGWYFAPSEHDLPPLIAAQREWSSLLRSELRKSMRRAVVDVRSFLIVAGSPAAGVTVRTDLPQPVTIVADLAELVRATESFLGGDPVTIDAAVTATLRARVGVRPA
jgi:hypothetical protein